MNSDSASECIGGEKWKDRQEKNLDKFFASHFYYWNVIQISKQYYHFYIKFTCKPSTKTHNYLRHLNATETE